VIQPVRLTPWQTTGTNLETATTIEEALEKSGLNWEVAMKPVLYDRWIGTGDFSSSPFQTIPNKFAIVRKDDGRCFNIVGQQYTPFQNAEAAAFGHTLVDTGQATYGAAGSLHGGAKVWWQYKLNQTAMIKGVDQIGCYLTLVNGHDGLTSFKAFWTKIRIVCINTFLRAINSAANNAMFSARHRPNIAGRIEEAKQLLGFATAEFAGWIEEAEMLAARSFMQHEMDEFLNKLLEINVELPTEKQPHKVAAKHRIEELVETGAGLQMPEIKGTRWALFNAVTEYVDHEHLTTEDRRLTSAWFGAGSELKAKAWSGLLKN
jgi:phage/plasmid-like protein (TIGR03299 family)